MASKIQMRDKTRERFLGLLIENEMKTDDRLKDMEKTIDWMFNCLIVFAILNFVLAGILIFKLLGAF